MTEQELDKWFCHLKVETKEAVMEMDYPICTEMWNRLMPLAKEDLYNRHGGRNAHDHHKWKKNNPSLT